MKLLTIIGARPQFIKAAAVSRAIFREKGLTEVIIHTGQHFDKNMSEVFFEEMQIPHPNYHLNINSLSHGAMTGRMLEGIEKIIHEEKPDYTLVYGDTNSTLAGALAAKKLHCKVIHVEAGLRSFNMAMPEEINRILTDRISDILFCPTDTAVQNLHKEGFEHFQSRIVQCGDVMEDAALFYATIAGQKSSIIERLKLTSLDYLLCTVHRAENTDDPKRLSSIITAINTLHAQWPVVLPLHPRTRKKIESFGMQLHATVIEPVGYFDMIQLIRNAKLVLTDSGGLQKEAFFFNKYCVTMRDQTEWVELVDNQYNQIVGAETEGIVSAAKRFIDQPFVKAHNLYGGGKAATKIVNTLMHIG